MKPIFLKKGTGRGRVLALKSDGDFERLVKVWASEKYTMALLADVDGEWFVEVEAKTARKLPISVRELSTKVGLLQLNRGVAVNKNMIAEFMDMGEIHSISHCVLKNADIIPVSRRYYVGVRQFIVGKLISGIAS